MREHAAAQWGMSRRIFLGRAGALAAGSALAGMPSGALAWARSGGAPAEGAVASHGAAVAHEWLRAVYRRVRLDGYVPAETAIAPDDSFESYFPQGRAASAGRPGGFTPTSAARLYAYMGIAMYEALLPGMPGHRTLAGQLTGMPAMPKGSRSAIYDWPVVLSGALARMTPWFFESRDSRRAIADHHATVLADRRAAGVDRATVTRSEARGRSVANALQPWIDADGFSAIRAKAAETPYVPPVGPGLWRPTSPNFGPAIEPYWSEIRPFALRSGDEVTPIPCPTFSTSGAFRDAALRVLEEETAAKADREKQTIARFWTDNPTQSGLPAGHWMHLVGQVAAQRGLSLETAVATYAPLGVALADAFLSCWTEKYRSNLLRPVDYIHRYVQHTMPARDRWRPITNTPQFPEYTSGHSVSSLAAATVLTDALGAFPYTDVHDLVSMAAPPGVPDQRPLSNTRTFDDFMHAAEEAARSRVYGGIHYEFGIENGKAQGAEVGQLVINRVKTRR
jgi:hypothetical protein